MNKLSIVITKFDLSTLVSRSDFQRNSFNWMEIKVNTYLQFVLIFIAIIFFLFAQKHHQYQNKHQNVELLFSTYRNDSTKQCHMFQDLNGKEWPPNQFIFELNHGFLKLNITFVMHSNYDGNTKFDVIFCLRRISVFVHLSSDANRKIDFCSFLSSSRIYFFLCKLKLNIKFKLHWK